MKHIYFPYAIALTLLLAGCGGGGSNPLTSSSNGIPPPLPTPTPASAATPSNATPAPNTAIVTLTAPARAAVPGTFLAPVTQIVAVIKSINGSTSIPSTVSPTTIVPVTGSNCSGTTCTFTLPAPAGSISAVITEYAGSSYTATGSFTFTSTGVAGQTQAFTLAPVLGPSSIAIEAPILTYGYPSTQSLNFLVTDASGAELTDDTPFANSVTLTDTDTSGATELQVGSDASTDALSVPFTNAGEVIDLVYNGAQYSTGFQINVSGTAAVVATTSGYKEAPYKGK